MFKFYSETLKKFECLLYLCLTTMLFHEDLENVNQYRQRNSLFRSSFWTQSKDMESWGDINEGKTLKDGKRRKFLSKLTSDYGSFFYCVPRKVPQEKHFFI